MVIRIPKLFVGLKPLPLRFSGDWILPFKGRNRSLALDQNFLWRNDNVYIMDNHRAALWCWMQHLSFEKRYGLFHIDAHYDAAEVSRLSLENSPMLNAISLEDYLSYTTPSSSPPVPLYRWNNYLYIFQNKYPQCIGNYFIATHEIDKPPPDPFKWEEINIAVLYKFYREALFTKKYECDGWILNIDLDYFFASQPGNKKCILQSDEYIHEIFSATAEALFDGRVACLTIALSPECCGSWNSSEKLCSRFLDILGFDFSLP
jgi:hypothetical protein